VVWVAVFQRNLLFASSGGTVRMDVSSEQYPFQVILCLCGRKQCQCLLGGNEVIKLKGDRVWF